MGNLLHHLSSKFIYIIYFGAHIIDCIGKQGNFIMGRYKDFFKFTTGNLLSPLDQVTDGPGNGTGNNYGSRYSGKQSSCD